MLSLSCILETQTSDQNLLNVGEQNPAIVAKLDLDGKVIEAFSLIDPVGIANITTHYFISNYINVLDDNSFIIGARTSYVSGAFGVSANSLLDFTFVKFSSIDRSVQWVTSIDLNNNIDQEMSTSIFGNSLYFLMTSTPQDYCLGFLSAIDGKMQSNMCMNLPSNLTTIEKLDFIHISQKWIFASFPDQINTLCRNIIVFDIGNLINQYLSYL